MVGTRGRPHLTEPKLDARIIVPVTRKHYEQLVEEARSTNYRSLAAYLRDRKLTVSPSIPGDGHH